MMSTVVSRSAVALGLILALAHGMARADIVPMYQLYSPSQTDFFYTTNWTERTNAIASYGYLDRGTAYFIDDGQVRDVGTAAWQRFYKGWPQREHFYTWTQADINYVLTYGWVYESSDGMIKTGAGTPGTVALFRYNKFDGATSDLQHYYTTNWQDSLQPWMAGWGSDGIVGFVYTAPQNWDYAARFISQTVPATMENSGSYQVSVTMRNVGHQPWYINDNVYLKLASASLYWCVQGQNNRIGNPIYDSVNLPSYTPPGADAVFTFNVKPGGCLGNPAGFQWRMWSDTKTFRSEYTPIASVTIVAPAAQLVGQSVSAAQLTGQTYRARVAMLNPNGSNVTWSPTSGHALVPNGDSWGQGLRIPIGATVAPGQTYTFDWNFVAPAAGLHNFQWHMVNGQGQMIGTVTPLIPVTVVGSAGDLSPTVAPPGAPNYGGIPIYPPF